MRRFVFACLCPCLIACEMRAPTTVKVESFGNTYFSYDDEEVSDIPRLRAGSEAATVSQLLSWDARIVDTIREAGLAPTEAARLFAAIAIGQRDALLLGGMTESIDGVGALVTCELVPQTCSRMRSFYLQSDFDASIADLVFDHLRVHLAETKSTASSSIAPIDPSGMRQDYDPETPEARFWKRWVAGSSVDVPAPMPVGSAEELEELRIVTDAVLSITEWQRQRIFFWSAQPNRETSVGVWIGILDDSMTEKNVSLQKAADLRAAAGAAMHDGLVTGWNAKFLYPYPRPTQRDIIPPIPALILLPASSAYPGEDAIIAAAAGSVLAYAFPDDAISVENMQREAADSRIWAGANYPFSTDVGLRIGEETAKKILEDDRLSF